MSIVISDKATKQTIAFNVKRLLGDRSKYWLAKQAGEYESTIGNIVEGRHLCNAGLLARVAEALDVGVGEIMKPIPRKKKKLRNSA